MKSVQKGFTLIELMIVVAIIGILAAIAIPQYQNYIAKSQVSRVMSETGGLKTVVESCLNEGRGLAAATAPWHSNLTTVTSLPADECDLGATASTLLDATAGAAQGDGAAVTAGTNGYPQVARTGTGADQVVTITSTFGSSAAASVVGTGTAANTLVWERDNQGTWRCFTTVDSKFRPNGCTASS
ncbi:MULTISPECIES: pilin [unclassified Acinetobacter]|uniref:pilin n=1 Tax=unclassified Acinetobacter TaxID=196816 RepID=UPI0015D36740|nr:MULTISPECIES: pilin [unclassified Acinetobacter]